MTVQVISLENISKQYGSRLVLNDVSLSLNQGERVALVGENGVGKTTLARIILGHEQPDSGSVTLTPGVRLGYLPQQVDLASQRQLTLQRYLRQQAGNLDEIAHRMAALEQRMSGSAPDGDQLEHILAEYGQLQETFELRGGYDFEHRAEQVLAGLGLARLDPARSLATLSGGEMTRLALAAILLSSPNLLVLDEPTNHLDFEALAWLEAHLAGYKQCLLTISHDRQFLNTVITKICELSHSDHRLTIYHGNYDYYLTEREAVYQKQMDAFHAQREEIKQLRSLIKSKTHSAGKGKPASDNNKMGHNFLGERKEGSRGREIQAAKQKLETLLGNPIEPVLPRWKMRPNFDPAALGSREVVRLERVSKGYEGQPVLRDISLTIRNGERLMLVAPNGSGKSTLLKLMVGLIQPDEGSVFIAREAAPGYLDQNQETLDPAATVLETYRQVAEGDEPVVRGELSRYGLFKGDEVFQQVGSLSVGQQRKLQLAMLMAQQANLLIMDEPTNHIDFTSMEQLEQALADFEGTIVAVSHDRWFINRLATRTLTLAAGRIAELHV